MKGKSRRKAKKALKATIRYVGRWCGVKLPRRVVNSEYKAVRLWD